MMGCRHDGCTCRIEGCGLDHPAGWRPVMYANINTVVVGGDDLADCVAHYLLGAGYPADRPEHLRLISEAQAERMQARRR